MKQELQKKILAVTQNGQFGAILRCALGVERDALPRFTGRAVVTSDGFVMATFISSDGETHLGAFVGSKKDLVQNVEGLSRWLKLSPEEDRELRTLVDGWLGIEIIHVTSKPKAKRLPGEMGPN